MKGFRLVSLTEVGDKVLKSYYADMNKKRLKINWRVVVVGVDPYTLHLYPVGLMKSALKVADPKLIVQSMNNLFLQNNAVVKVDYDLEVLEDE